MKYLDDKIDIVMRHYKKYSVNPKEVDIEAYREKAREFVKKINDLEKEYEIELL